MSTRIRLRRMGATKRPFFRVVVTDQRSPRDGRFIENIGKYHPLEDPSLIEIDEERALHWLRSGAQPSDSVRNLLDRIGVWEKFSAERPSVIRREEIQRSNARSKEAKAKRAEAARPKPAVAPGAEVAEPAKAESAPAPVESTEVESTEVESAQVEPAQVEPAESPEAPAAQPTEETAAE